MILTNDILESGLVALDDYFPYSSRLSLPDDKTDVDQAVLELLQGLGLSVDIALIPVKLGYFLHALFELFLVENRALLESENSEHHIVREMRVSGDRNFAHIEPVPLVHVDPHRHITAVLAELDIVIEHLEIDKSVSGVKFGEFLGQILLKLLFIITATTPEL